MVGHSRFAHRSRNERGNILRHSGRRLHFSKLHLSPTRAGHDPRAHSRQLHFHQALLRLQSLFDLRIPDRPFRSADEERSLGGVPVHAVARIGRAIVRRRDRASARLRNGSRRSAGPDRNTFHLHRRDRRHCAVDCDIHHARRYQGRHLDGRDSGLYYDRQRGGGCWFALLLDSRWLA